MDEELAQRIRGHRFELVRWQETYDPGEVDAFLAVLATEVAAGRSVAGLVEDARFTPKRLAPGYDMGPVDDFLDQVVAESAAAALAGASYAARQAAERVAQTRFAVRLRGSRYATSSVTTALRDLSAAALREQPPGSVASVRALRLARLGRGYDADEVDAFLLGLGLTPPRRA